MWLAVEVAVVVFATALLSIPGLPALGTVMCSEFTNRAPQAIAASLHSNV